MTLRNRVLALAIRWKLGDQAGAVLKMLPEPRQNVVRADVEAMHGLQPQDAMERLAALRTKQARRLDRLARRHLGDGWNRLDPRAHNLVLHHGQRQNH